MKKLKKYSTAFLVTYIIVFIMFMLVGKFSGFNFKDPIFLSWNDLFTYYLRFLLKIPIVFGAIVVYLFWDDKSPKNGEKRNC